MPYHHGTLQVIAPWYSLKRWLLNGSQSCTAGQNRSLFSMTETFVYKFGRCWKCRIKSLDKVTFAAQFLQWRIKLEFIALVASKNRFIQLFCFKEVCHRNGVLLLDGMLQLQIVPEPCVGCVLRLKILWYFTLNKENAWQERPQRMQMSCPLATLPPRLAWTMLL